MSDINIAKVYDVLGWFSPCIIKVKILLQKVWERKIDLDDKVPPDILETWLRWRKELVCLSTKPIPRCYFPSDFCVTSTELHGFCDASELAYAAVVYQTPVVRLTDSSGRIQVSLVTLKTKVAPLKCLSIPRLELCGALLLAQLLHHSSQVLKIPLSHLHAWTDSTVVLQWLDISPRHFKTYVGNRVSTIIDLIPPNKWHHVKGHENPADCGSRGLFPSELVDHTLWWNGLIWLGLHPDNWSLQSTLSPSEDAKDEESEVSSVLQASVEVNL